MELKLVKRNEKEIYNITIGQTVPHTHVHIIPQSKEFANAIHESERKKN